MYRDGNRGTIQFRQYPLELLYTQNTFEEVAFLLIWGTLPSVEGLKEFQRNLASAMKPSPLVNEIIRSFP